MGYFISYLPDGPVVDPESSEQSCASPLGLLKQLATDWEEVLPLY